MFVYCTTLYYFVSYDKLTPFLEFVFSALGLYTQVVIGSYVSTCLLASYRWGYASTDLSRDLGLSSCSTRHRQLWLYIVKFNLDGSVNIFEARLFAKGFSWTYDVDYFETISSMSYLNSIYILFSLAVNWNDPCQKCFPLLWSTKGSLCGATSGVCCSKREYSLQTYENYLWT